MVSHDGDREPWRVRALRRLRGLDGPAPDEAARPDAPTTAPVDADDEVVEAEVVDEALEAEPPHVAAATPPPFASASTPPRPAPPAGDLAAERRRRRFRAVITETYPSVAEHLIALAEGGPDADLDDWLAVARLLSDDLRHRSGGLSAEARSRALEQTVAAALEAQARSSARLAGYADDVHDDPSPFDGDPVGTTIWEHYVCPEARLALQSLHGEALGNWLDALNELWEAANAVYVTAVARADGGGAPTRPEPVTGPSSGDARPSMPPVAALPAPEPDDDHAALPVAPAPPVDRPEQARIRLKAALVQVEELSLW